MMDIETIELAKADIITSAGRHEGRYLLPKRYGIHKGPRWAAAEQLVDDGMAQWLPLNSCVAPGIQLNADVWTRNNPPMTETTHLRVKGGRLQRAYTYQPWIEGRGDPVRVRWVDVPVVDDSAADDEVLNAQ